MPAASSIWEHKSKIIVDVSKKMIQKHPHKANRLSTDVLD
jgi:hypothetical protein